MAVQKEPILKKCRYLGISPADMGVSKKESIRFKNANNRKKISEYGLQLKEKPVSYTHLTLPTNSRV